MAKPKAKPAPAKPKVEAKPPVAAKKAPKNKEVVSKAKVEKPKKKHVSKHHPLAAKAKAKAKAKVSKAGIIADPDLDDVIVDNEDNDTIDQAEVSVADLDESFDVESLSSDSVVPDSDSDDIVPQQSSVRFSNATLAYPEVSTFSSGNYTYTTHADGTQRVTVTVSLADVFRAQGYEVRISS